MSNQCKHGQLARVCEHCEAAQTIDKLKGEIAVLRSQKQILLMEEDYRSLVKDAEIGRRAPPDKRLQELCTYAATTMPTAIRSGRPWGCILINPDIYCDECPVKDICPKDPKEWIK